jgi:hypothetical protein
MRPRAWLVTVFVLATFHFIGSKAFEIYSYGHLLCDENCVSLQAFWWSLAWQFLKLLISYGFIVTITEMIVVGIMKAVKGLASIARHMGGKQSEG